MKRLLIIEDDADFAGIIEMALTGRVVVLVKNDGYGLVKTLHDFKPDIILIDNHVGQKTAKEIVAEIRLCNGFAATPVILFSAHSNIEHIAKELMASAWLLKPFKLTDLYTSIETVLLEVT